MDALDVWLKLDMDAYDIMNKATDEYASRDEILENFRVVGEMLGLPARQVLMVYLMKHIISITKGISLREPMRGRIIDSMNYLRLLALMDHEEGTNGRN